MMEEIKPKKERKFLKAMGDIALTLFRELVLGIGKKVINKVGNKRQGLVITSIILASTFAIAQFPNTLNKQRLGFQTTADGLVWRGALSDTASIQPVNNQNAWVILDTINLKFYTFDFTSNVWNLVGGAQGLTMPFDSITFNTAKNGTVGVGEVEYNDTHGSLIQGLKGGNVTNVIGQQLHQRVNNRTGAPLAKGDVVYLAGSQGNRITVAKGLAVSDAFSANTFGVVAESIADNQSGFIITEGLITGLNTSALTEDSAVYLSPTVPGALTSTKPQAPQHSVYIGVCVKSNNGLGELFVKIRNGLEMDELHDVRITSPVDRASLYYRSSEKLWRDTTAALLVSDTASMLTPYFRDADTTSLNLTSRFNTKLNISDTASMLAPYLRKADTAFISNRINLKVNLSDTLNMLVPYLRKADTTNMLLPYFRDADTTQLNLTSRFAAKLNISDAASTYTPLTRSISTTSPLQGGGDLSANRTLSILSASDIQSGVVSTTAQLFSGNKVFKHRLTADSLFYLNNTDPIPTAILGIDLTGGVNSVGKFTLGNGLSITSSTLLADTNLLVTRFDTASMLTPYFRDADTTQLNLTSRFATKLNISDTSVFARDNQISGTSGQVAYFNSSNSVISDAGLIYNATNKSLGINTTTTSGANLIIKNSQEPSRATVVATQTFAADTTNWTAGTDWTFNGTQAVATAATGDLTYTPALTITSGNAYEITYTVTGYSTGTLTARLGNASFALPTHSATANVILLLPTSATGGFRFTTSSFTGNLDNVSVVEISNAAPVIFAGQDDGAATLYNSLRMPNSTTLAFGGGGARTTGVGNNTFIGINAGLYNTTGSNNNFIGNQAGFSNTLGSNNNFFGLNAGQNNTIGNNNSFFGSNAGLSNTSGTSNVFLGNSAGRFNLTGGNNIFFGTESGEFNTTGTSNIYFGVGAGENNRVGTNNTFFGLGAGGSNRGSFNLAFGDNAFNNTTLADSLTGSSNIGIGLSVGRNIAGAAAGNVAIGNSINLPNSSGSNQVVIKNVYFATGASGTGTTIAAASKAGIKTNAPNRDLEVAGEVRITDLTTDAPTRLVGADADGDLGQVTLGAGLSLASSSLLADTSFFVTRFDTAAMLTPYFRDADTTSLNLTSRFNTKLNISDTLNMLVPYLRKADTTNMLLPYFRDADTSQLNLTSRFAAKQNTLSGTGFIKASGTNITYDNSSYLRTGLADSTYLKLTGGTLTGGLSGTSINLSSSINSIGDIFFGSNSSYSGLKTRYFKTTDVSPNRDLFIGSVGTIGTWAGRMHFQTSYNTETPTTAMTINEFGNINMNGTLGVTGATTLGSTLAVSGNITEAGNNVLTSADTTSILLPYLRKADTTNMLLPYFRDADTTSLNLTSRFAAKLNLSDTIKLTTFGTSNAATLINKTLNIPNYKTLSVTNPLQDYLVKFSDNIGAGINRSNIFESGTTVDMASSDVKLGAIKNNGTFSSPITISTNCGSSGSPNIIGTSTGNYVNNCSSGTAYILLPDPADASGFTVGRILTITNLRSNQSIVLNTSGSYSNARPLGIDGAAESSIAAKRWITVQSNGTNWYIIATGSAL